MSAVEQAVEVDCEKLMQFVFPAVDEVAAALNAALVMMRQARPVPRDGVVAKLQRGALVADVGCGHGASKILMARAFPNSTFAGCNYHDHSIETARQRAREVGVADRVSFEIAPAAAYGGSGYDL